MQPFIEKFADKSETGKNFKYLDTSIKSLIKANVKTQENEDN